jgi:signal transduction histidine kinase
MDQDRFWNHSPYVILVAGTLLVLFAVVHHLQEHLTLNHYLGPSIALLMNALPGIALAYSGYWLSQTETTPGDRRTVTVWTIAGGALFLSVMIATFLVETIEGRAVAHLTFPLLISIEAGALAGLVAGYYNVQADAETRRARTATHALAFVNSLIRHDLRNDLTVIQGHAELLESQTAVDGSAGGDPGLIRAKSEEAMTLVETTRAIADTLVGDADLEPVDLAEMSAELAEQIDAIYDVAVRTDLPAQAKVAANAGLRSVVDNLLENAADHNDADEPWVAVAVNTEEETVTLVVTDNGPGIPENIKQAINEGSGGTDREGGLSLIQSLVDAYGGRIRVEDNDPRGTRFVIQFPRARPP